MTENEKKEVRHQALIDYHDAVDNYKANCGRLSQLIERTRKLVESFDTDKLGIASSKDGKTIFVESLKDFRLPSHEEVLEAIEICQKARKQEERMYFAAVESGANVEILKRPNIRR